ncbi:MAG: polysaccharide deacetylase family protein, partial [Clostridia bacterium]|nr:polysaccharide deacetylase family protein [Clostridia bacterium]
GVTQDIRLIEILDKYGLKCTFNLNSEFLGLEGTLDRNGRTVRHDKIARNKIKEVYKNHEVAVHTLTHPFLPSLDEKEIIRQVENDRQNLSEICGYEVVSMAYPCGGENNDDRVAEIIRNNTGVRLARGLESTYNFDLQDNPLRFKPTVYYIEDCLDEIVDRFLKLDSDKPQLLYIWGHSYEMDAEYISWEKFEEICKRLSGHDDIFYGTNKDVLLDS